MPRFVTWSYWNVTLMSFGYCQANSSRTLLWLKSVSMLRGSTRFEKFVALSKKFLVSRLSASIVRVLLITSIPAHK